MILSAISLSKKFDLSTPLNASEWGQRERNNIRYLHVSYSGHTVEDGSVRIYAMYGRPADDLKHPVILLLADAGKTVDTEMMEYFIEKGYAVLMVDYSGKMYGDKEGCMRTSYPPSLEHGNYEKARGLYDMKGLQAEETTWFEWAYVALFSIKYLKSREDVGKIGIIGIKKGGDIAWQAMLSSDVACGIPVNAAGWRSFSKVAKFGDNIMSNLSDDEHRYIAAVEAQSYAPYVQCPVLMLCALRDSDFDCDRAYDTYSRIGNPDGNALVYSSTSGACIGPNALYDMDMFLEKFLKGREIYIPDTLNVAIKEVEDRLAIEVDCDKEGILDSVGVYYAEADVKTKSTYRDWKQIYHEKGRAVKGGKAVCYVKPFAGTSAVFVYAYAKYINGFRVTSKIVCKRMPKPDPTVIKNRMLFSGKEEIGSFCVAENEAYSVGGIFLEKEALPKATEGYGGIHGVYSIGGVKTYKISSPMYIPDENALLEFDVYLKEDDNFNVVIEVADIDKKIERFSCVFPVKGGGKWKRIILKASDFKGENGIPLSKFGEGKAISFDCETEENEYAVTNILWL